MLVLYLIDCRYGNSYLLTLVQSNPNEESGQKLDSAVLNKFGAAPTQESYHLSNLCWSIPRRPNASWSQVYRNIESFVLELNQRHSGIVRDFFLVQDSLEQVFTWLAANDEDEPKTKQVESWFFDKFNFMNLDHGSVKNSGTCLILNILLT